MRPLLRSTLPFLPIAALLLAISPAAAQAPVVSFETVPYFGAGVVANAPSGTGGISVALIRPGALGLYADGRTSIRSPGRDSFFLSGITAEEAEHRDGDERLRDAQGWWTVNLGAVYPVTAEVALYLGGGYTHRSEFAQFYDATTERGEAGYYWVEDVDRSGSQANVLGGMIVHAGPNFLFQFGADLAPRGFTLGAMYAIPR
jgi:hypothetical protein